MDILVQPSVLSLVGNMNHVVIYSTTDVAFVLTVDGNNVPVVQHTYSPNDQNRIEIDLKNIIQPLLSFRLQDVSTPYQQTGVAKSFTITVTEINSDGTTGMSSTSTFTVLRAGIDHFDGDVSSFLQQNFLTWQPNVKPVTYYTPEFLTYYAVVSSTVKCKAYFEGGTSSDLTLAPIPAGQCWTIPVQYAIIAGKCNSQMPMYYDVWVENGSGQRMTYIQRYYASDMRSEEEEWILFENSLGGIDTFRAYGDSENTAEHTHNVAEIEENVEEYRVDTTRKFNKNTGYLGKRERVWLLDFFPSLGKYIYVSSYIRRITVIDSDVNYKAKELPSTYNFTYRYADSRPYLNIPRVDTPITALNITVPDLGSFTVAPRLVEFPRLTLSGGALFPVQNPYSEGWSTTTAVALLDFLIHEIETNYSSGGGVGHTHPNISLLNGLYLLEGYLLADANKIKAGYADVAGALSSFSSLDSRYLSKTDDDVAQGNITFMKKILVKLLGVFENGVQFGNEGSYGITGDGDASLHNITGNQLTAVNATISGLLQAALAKISSLESESITTKDLIVTGAAHFFSLIIDELRSVGGAVILTAGNATVEKVETVTVDSSTYYKLSWRATDGDKEIGNQFISGDGVICMTFNATTGMSSNVSNKYYWLRCTGAGSENITENPGEENETTTRWNFILLNPAIGVGNTGSVPEIGDKIAQLGYNGNAADAAQRQNAIIIAAYNSPDPGIDAPLIAHYSGIDDFALSSHRQTYISKSGSKFVGDFEVRTSSGGSTVLTNLATWLNSLSSEIDSIRSQTDGLMEIFFGNGTPVPSDTQPTGTVNDPVSTWPSADYNSHIGDLYYDKDLNSSTYGLAYQWAFHAAGTSITKVVNGQTVTESFSEDTWRWDKITDQQTIAALQAAAAAQDTARSAQTTANSKIRCFAVTPYPPYDAGDLWIKDNGEIMHCVRTKDASGSFDVTDWVLKIVSEDPKNFYEKLYNVNPSAFDSNDLGFVDIFLGGTSNQLQEGSFYYNASENMLWQGRNGYFVELTGDDSTPAEVAAAVEVIQNALGDNDFITAGKRRIFLTTPTPQYCAGNIWVKSFYVYNALNQSQEACGRDIFTCRVSRSSGNLNAADWLRVSNSTSAELKVFSDQIRALLYDSNNNMSLLEMTTKAITMLNSAFNYNSQGSIIGTKWTTLLLGGGAAILAAALTDSDLQDPLVSESALEVKGNAITAAVTSQTYNRNLFGFTEGLVFTGTAIPFIQAYGVEFAGIGTGTISGFGAAVKGVTITCLARAVGTSATVTFSIIGTTAGGVPKNTTFTREISTSWTDIKITVDGIVSLSSISATYTNQSISTVALRNLKIESGSVATNFCISDKDGEMIENTNMFTTTVDYNRDPIFMRINANETLDTSGVDGHGSVMTFYRSNNSSDSPFMVYNDYIGWPTDPADVRTKVLTAGKVYTISFWAKAATDGLQIHTGLYGKVTDSQDDSPSYTTHNSGAYYSDKSSEGVYDNGGCECLHHLTTSWKRYYARFYIKTGVTVVPIIQCNNGLPLGSEESTYLYVADVRMEEGYIADENDPMSISGARTRSEAKMKLSTDEIELKLNDTGININDKTIILDAEKTTVRGELQASKVRTNDKGYGYIDMTDGLMNVFNANGINQLRFGVDDSGNIVLRYYDATTGNVLWDLGPSGLEKSVAQAERVVSYTWCMMKTWDGVSSWVQVGLDQDFDIRYLEDYCMKDNGSSESYLAYLVRNLRQGVEDYPSVGNGTVWQYEAYINAGQYRGGSGTYGSKAISNEAARKYDKIFLAQQPSSSDPLTLSGTGGTTGDITSEWYADFIRIRKIEIWRTYDATGHLTPVTESGGKTYAVPSGYAEGLNGFDVNWEVDTANGTYIDTPIFFQVQGYEYGSRWQDEPFWINKSKIEGLENFT